MCHESNYEFKKKAYLQVKMELPAAFQIIELLKEYENCHEYTRMNNVLIGF